MNPFEVISLGPVGVILPPDITVDVPDVVDLCFNPAMLWVEVVVVLAPLQQFMVLLAVDAVSVQSELVPRD